MLEVNFIKHINTFCPDIPVYSFSIPTDAPSKAFCFENAGSGIAGHFADGSVLRVRNVKLTLSSKDIADIYNTKELTKYIDESSKLGDLKILNARVMNFVDNYDSSLKIYERTFTIKIQYKE